MKIRKILFVCILIFAMTGSAIAVMTQEEVATLGGPDLTIFGAQKAANADGSIPAWTGGMTKGSDGWYYEGKLKVAFTEFDPKKSGLRPDPFADDAILYTITAENMDKYADKLSDGMMALLAKYPDDVKFNVYPSRRPASYAKEVMDGYKNCALNATLEKNGNKLANARMGIPFPIPKSGIEAVWNHLVHWTGTMEVFHYHAWIVTAAGRKVNTSDSDCYLEYPLWDPNTDRTDIVRYLYDNNFGPSNRAGEGLIAYFPTDKEGAAGQPVWRYLPGQRRVKLAPECRFDGPSVTVAGAGTYDETYMFNGSPEKYDWKLLGKKEMIIPYNNYRAQYWTHSDDLLGKHFLKPEPIRHELHRVWVVEGTLKPSERHIYKRRVLYLDEDSWTAHLADQFDANDKLWRMKYLISAFSYDYPAMSSFNDMGIDLISGVYYVLGHVAEDGGIFYAPGRPAQKWSPNILSGRGVR